MRAIVLEGAGKYFTVGLDLKDAAASNLGGSDSASRDVARKFLHQRQHLLALQEAFTALERCPQPVIAAVHGACGKLQDHFVLISKKLYVLGFSPILTSQASTLYLN